MTPAEIVALPASPLATDALEIIGTAMNMPIANHSVRTYLFARLAAADQGRQAGRDYDDDLLFCTCVLHDIGITDAANGNQRYEVDGADFVAGFLRDHGRSEADVATVWEAVALNTSGGIAERRGPICALARAGVVIDFGRDTDFIPEATASAIHLAYPRIDLATEFVDAVVGQAVANPPKSQPYSITADLVRERSEPGESSIEMQARAIRWHIYP